MRIDEGRIKHMHGVAEYMYSHAHEYELNPDEMYLLGLVHDIGYINGPNGHEEYGAELVGDNYYGDFIRYHGKTPQMYADAHGIVKAEIPNEMLLLWEADMSINSDGDEVSFQERLEGIKNHHGSDSKAYHTCIETVSFLENRKAIKFLTSNVVH